MTSPFRSVAPGLRLNGYSIIPLQERGKAIYMPGWTAFCKESATDSVFQNWMALKPSCNIGLCCGPASGVTALDFDKDVDGLHEKILRIVGESPVRKAGRQGFTAFYRFSNERSVGYSINGERVIDILANGRQTVLPPSIHPEGMAYRWITPKTLENTLASELPEIRPDAIAKVMKLFRNDSLIDKPVYREPFDFSDKDDVGRALQYISADDYDTWLRIGMAIKDHFGEAGFSLWDQWSATSPKYAGEKDTRKRWLSFRGTGVTIGSLFHYAIENGYKQRLDPVASPVAPGGNLEHGGDFPGIVKAPDLVTPEKKTPDLGTLGKNILSAPGLPGMVADFINKTAQYEQPLLALAASLTFSGFMMGHKVRGQTDLRTNIYTLGIAHSGAGKDHARVACKKLLMKLGLPEMAPPASGASIKSNLLEQEGKGIILIDEFGKYFGNINGRYSGPHQQEIISNMMEIFTSSNSSWTGKMYADTKLNPTKAVIQPCLCMYPVTTPKNFYASVTSREAEDGFLARFLIFESQDFPIEEQENRQDTDDIPLPLLDKLTEWKLRKRNNDPNSNIGESHIYPATVFYDPSAAKLIREYQRAGRERARQEIERGSSLSAVYNRVGEMAGKLALIGHDREGLITSDVAEWAVAVATFCSDFLVRLIGTTIGENEHERTLKRVLEIIRKLAEKNGVAMHSELVDKTSFLKKKERDEILGDLVGTKIERRFIEKQDGKPGPATCYYVLL